MSDVEREERRLRAEVEALRGFRTDGTGEQADRAKAYLDALGALAYFYEQHGRLYDASVVTRSQLRTIAKTGVREALVLDLHLREVELQLEMGQREAATRGLRQAKRAAATSVAPAGWAQRVASLERAIAKLPVAVPEPTVLEQWAHPTFGVGTLERRDDDVLHLRFADGTVRKIAQRYLTRV